MIQLNKFFVFLLSLFSAVLSSDEIAFLPSDNQTILKVNYIVQGVVAKVNKVTDNGRCFSFVYELKVDEVFKGKVKKSDVIVVGLNVNSLHVFDNQRQLIFLEKLPKDYYSYCIRPEDTKWEVSHVTLGYTLGVFDVSNRQNLDDSIIATKCDKRTPVIFEHLLIKQGIDPAGCEILKGSYKKVLTEINSVLSDWQSRNTKN